MDLLLQVLVPPPHLESPTGRFVVGELITCNVLLPFVARLSDPDWLNGLIIQVCGSPDQPEDRPAPDRPAVAPPAPTDFPPPQEAKRLNSPRDRKDPPLRTEPETPSAEPAGCAATGAEEALGPRNTPEEEPPPGSCPSQYTAGSRSNSFYLENHPEPHCPFADCNQTSPDILVQLGREAAAALCVRQKERPAPEDDDLDLDLDEGYLGPLEAPCRTLPVNSRAESPLVDGSGDGLPGADSPKMAASFPLVAPSRELHLSVEQSSPGNELSDVSPLHGSSSIPSFSFDPLSSPEGPVVIQNLRITGTITAKEHRGTGSHPYTLYTIKVCLSAAPIPF